MILASCGQHCRRIILRKLFGRSLQAWDEGFETLGEKLQFRGWNNIFLAEYRRSHPGFSFACNWHCDPRSYLRLVSFSVVEKRGVSCGTYGEFWVVFHWSWTHSLIFSCVFLLGPNPVLLLSVVECWVVGFVVVPAIILHRSSVHIPCWSCLSFWWLRVPCWLWLNLLWCCVGYQGGDPCCWATSIKEQLRVWWRRLTLNRGYQFIKLSAGH